MSPTRPWLSLSASEALPARTLILTGPVRSDLLSTYLVTLLRTDAWRSRIGLTRQDGGTLATITTLTILHSMMFVPPNGSGMRRDWRTLLI
jgi:hypothetical protein